MKSLTCHPSHHWVQAGAAGAVAAVTMLWVGGMNTAFFEAGTVLLVMCLIPLARGLGARGGAITGLLLGLVWVAARLGFTRNLDVPTLFSELNVMAVVALMTIGGLAGMLFGPSAELAAAAPESPSRPAAKRANQRTTLLKRPSAEIEDSWGRALARHREWMTGWDQTSYPWTSFDNHVREMVRLLTGMQRLRCYRVSNDGLLYPLSSEHQSDAIEPPSKELLGHVISTGRRFLAHMPSTGPLVQTLADATELPLVWAVPIRDRDVSIGLVTAEAMPDPAPGQEQLQKVADLIEEWWLHVHHLDSLRMARQTDRASGLINRTEFLPAMNATLEQCYKLHEPAVVMTVCLEGLRGLDDASQWAKRDELIERVGQTIAAGIRKDDLVGRFSDAQFVALLRRLDLPLAELISRKLLSSIAKVICDFGLTTWITPRAGLSGSGFLKIPPETLLKHATSALHTARAQDVLLMSEPPEDPKGNEQS